MKSDFKMSLFLVTIIMLMMNINASTGQQVARPTSIKKPVGFAISGPLRNNPIVSYSDFRPEEIPINREINPGIKPPDFSKMSKDSGEQTEIEVMTSGGTTTRNYAGQNTNLYPPDANGDVNATYYFQVVNLTYTI